ncbi:minor capsid protein [Clostridium botulinum]|uniref:minor capsid protein n=2 Tax=Clostridium botulinum TaxID=1491 RepID=UPI001E65549A|nr:minor capsid protein [Clostridium botulinum]
MVIQMKSKDYWKKRSEQIANKQFNKTDAYISKLCLEYQEALYSIKKDIESFYQNFASNNQVTLDEARRLLNSNELSEFKMDLKEFRNKAKNNIDDIWEQELNNVSYKVRISRLQALQTQINNEIGLLYSKQQKGIESLLNNVYEDAYYRNIYEVHKGLGIGVDFAKLDTRTVEKVMSEKWQGSNYSSRIWNDKEKLIRELKFNLTQGFIRGDSIDKTSKIIAERLNVSKNRATTLVNTESAYITSKATFDSYGRSGVVKQYQILATLDLRTSKICREMDGKVFKLSEKEIGVNAPPFHPRCRSTTVVYFPDDIDEKRIAKDSKSEKYYVDGNMNYQQWHDKYVKDNPDEEIAEKKLQNKYSDKKIFERYSQVLKDLSPKSFEEFQDLRYNDIDSWNELKSNFKVANSYKVDYGEINPQKILELDKVAFEAKKTRFDYEPFSGRERRSVKKLSQGGNFAIMEFQNKQYLAHSAVNEAVEAEYKSIKGDKSDFILHKDDREFKTLVINGIPREYCTEAKFFEFINDNITIDYSGEITILSELDMCESCRGVLKQFKNKYPNVKVNIVSGKKCLNWRKRK